MSIEIEIKITNNSELVIKAQNEYFVVVIKTIVFL